MDVLKIKCQFLGAVVSLIKDNKFHERLLTEQCTDERDI